MPLSGGHTFKACTLETIQHIQYVIKNTTTLSWVNSVPHNYGEASAGYIKADEWRTLATIYLPIALVTLWGDDDGLPPASNSPFLPILDHTMALFQAVVLMCRNTMSKERAVKLLNFMKTWISGLHETHPHTKMHHPRPNIHASMHISDFIILFGPVMSWWCFPFERLVGVLQKIKTNDMVGGELTISSCCGKVLMMRCRSSRKNNLTVSHEGHEYSLVVKARRLSRGHSTVQGGL